MTILSIPAIVDGKTAATDFNNIQDGLTGNIYPRNSSGVATDKAADLGSSALPWLAASSEDSIPVGTIIGWYDYAGLLTMPQGWMLCDGSIVNESNYNSQHAAGDWLVYVGASPIGGIYLPNLNNKFLKGTDAATQSGTSAITSSGNVGHVVDMAHDHGGVATDASYTGSAMSDAGAGTEHYVASASHGHVNSVVSANVENRNIEPLNIKVKFLMKVTE